MYLFLIALLPKELKGINNSRQTHFKHYKLQCEEMTESGKLLLLTEGYYKDTTVLSSERDNISEQVSTIHCEKMRDFYYYYYYFFALVNELK